MKKMMYIFAVLMFCCCLSFGGKNYNVSAANCTANTHTGYHWIVTKQATCVTAGEKCYACACGKLRNTSTPIAPLGHNWIKKTGYYQCSRCTAIKKLERIDTVCVHICFRVMRFQEMKISKF